MPFGRAISDDLRRRKSGLRAGIPAGDAVASPQLSTRCLLPLTILGNVWATLQLNLAAVDRVSEGIEIPQERTPESDIAAHLSPDVPPRLPLHPRLR